MAEQKQKTKTHEHYMDLQCKFDDKELAELAKALGKRLELLGKDEKEFADLKEKWKKQIDQKQSDVDEIQEKFRRGGEIKTVKCISEITADPPHVIVKTIREETKEEVKHIGKITLNLNFTGKAAEEIVFDKPTWKVKAKVSIGGKTNWNEVEPKNIVKGTMFRIVQGNGTQYFDGKKNNVFKAKEDAQNVKGVRRVKVIPCKLEEAGK